MDIKAFGTIKKYQSKYDTWYSLLIRQNGRPYYVNAYFKEGEPVPNENHKLHIKARGKLFLDNSTHKTRLSLYDVEVIEDMGIDEIEVLNERKEEVALLAEGQKFNGISNNDDDLPW